MHANLVALKIGNWFLNLKEDEFARRKNAFVKLLLAKLGGGADLSKLKSVDLLNLCRKHLHWWSIDFTILEKQEFICTFRNFHREAIIMWMIMRFGSNKFARVTNFVRSKKHTRQELVAFLYDLYMQTKILREMNRQKLFKSLDKHVISHIFLFAFSKGS